MAKKKAKQMLSKLDEVFRSEEEMKQVKANKNKFGQRKNGLPDLITTAALAGKDYGSLVKIVDEQRKVRPKLTSSAKSHIVYILKTYKEKLVQVPLLAGGITKKQAKHIDSLLEAAKTDKVKKTKK